MTLDMQFHDMYTFMMMIKLIFNLAAEHNVTVCVQAEIPRS